ncbi:hypothetical protein BU16DRAFT_257116 [Lophium mytilinum]|uniref:Uncharacterized protein n=1 Tax=Lophium mytilinum TaxID=390894 RepID=A0A6A6R8M1_9PEZI|nr:hypothetical protein BU16DRAFT_257116 [Lophium mytilinum]
MNRTSAAPRMARGSAYTEGDGQRGRDRAPDYREARSYYTEDDDEDDEEGREQRQHRRRHRTSPADGERRRRRRHRDVEETRLAAELDIQDLRAARAEYYSVPAVERQKSSRRMAQAVEVERVASRRGTPVVRQGRSVRDGTTSGSGTRRRRKRVEDEGEDEGYVYSREVRERPRSPKVERAGTVRRVETVRESEGRSRGTRSMEAERPVRMVERVVSIKRADTPKVSRYVHVWTLCDVQRKQANVYQESFCSRTSKSVSNAAITA